MVAKRNSDMSWVNARPGAYAIAAPLPVKLVRCKHCQIKLPISERFAHLVRCPKVMVLDHFEDVE